MMRALAEMVFAAGFVGREARPLPSTGAAARKRAELRMAWRWYVPRAISIPAHGPRPAWSYRAARRNAHRRQRGTA